jgi:hypothetical protein
MLSEIQQRQLIAEIMSKAIDSGQIKFDPPPVQQIVQEAKPEPPTYEGGKISIFDLLTCIMFTLNLMGETDISWWLVFLPFAFPYIVFYGALWSVMLWAKFKNRKNKKEDGESKTN